MTAFLHGQSKILFFFQKKGIQRTNILRLSNSKAPSKGTRYMDLLTTYNVDTVTDRAPPDDDGNVKLMAQGAKQYFILHFST